MKKLIIIGMISGIFVFCGCQEEKTVQSPPAVSRSPLIVETADLASMKQDAVSILHESLTDEDPLVRTHAIEVVAELGRNEMMGSVVKMLKDRMVPVRFAAAVAVGDAGYKGGALSVKRLLRDENASVRVAAAYALTKLGKEDLSGMIIDKLKSDDQIAKANAALMLGKLGDKRAAGALKWVINDENSSDLVKIQSIVAISMLGVDKGTTYQRLWALLISNMADNKIMGIQGMRYLNTDDAKDAISTILMVEDDQTILYPEIRLYAAEQLGIMGDRSGKTFIAEYFTKIRPMLDRNAAERADSIAAMAIGHIGDAELVKYLPPMFRSKNRDLRLRASEAVLLLAG